MPEGKKRDGKFSGGEVTSCMSGNIFRFCTILSSMRTNRSASSGAVQAVFGPLSGYELINTPICPPPRLEGSEALHICRLSVLLGGVTVDGAHVSWSKSADRIS